MGQSLKDLIEEIKEVKQLLKHSNSSTPIETESLEIAKASYRISRNSLIVAFVIGIIGIVLIIIQIGSKVQIEKFNELLKMDSILVSKQSILISKDSILVGLYSSELTDITTLLGKTDKVIELSSTQLELNRKAQILSNRNRLILSRMDANDLGAIAREIITVSFIAIPNNHEKLNTIEKLLNLYNSGLQNSYLIQNDELFKRWYKTNLKLDGFFFELKLSNNLTPKEIDTKYYECISLSNGTANAIVEYLVKKEIKIPK